VKTLFRPFPDFRFGIHRPTVKGAGRDPERRAQLSFLRWVNGSGQPMTRQFLEGMWRSSAATLGYEHAEWPISPSKAGRPTCCGNCVAT
jgi:hypothetical protein